LEVAVEDDEALMDGTTDVDAASQGDRRCRVSWVHFRFLTRSTRHGCLVVDQSDPCAKADLRLRSIQFQSLL
jgi:hypothetical protein